MNNAKKKALALIIIALAIVLLAAAAALYMGGYFSAGIPSDLPSEETTQNAEASDGVNPTTPTAPTMPKIELTDENSLNLNNMQVVLPADPTDVETNAAKELVDYVEKMTGKAIPVVNEGAAVDAGIYVGDTEFTKANNVTHPSTEYGEGWAIKAVDGNLVLCGDSVRGTLYAVYHLLEDALGVHWWTYEEEYVPNTEAALVWNEYDDSGAPAFKYRDMHPGAASQSEDTTFQIRNRLNGHDACPPDGYGGVEAFGSPVYVHSFAYYVPSNMFNEHPEWFSEVDGKRINNSQLCMTNTELLDYMKNKLLDYIAADISLAEQNGTALPRWYSLVPNDWDKFCECDACTAAIEKSGLSGYLLKFVNAIAEVAAEEYPEVLIDTLAYWQYLDPPLDDTKPAENVIIRFADMDTDTFHSLSHENNSKTLQLMQAWADLVGDNERFFVWDYLVVWRDACPATFMYKLPDHFQTMLDVGFTGYFGEFENPINTDFWDMKMWLCAKMLEDPYQDFDALVDTFLNGYYGAAGPYIREYLDLAEACVANSSIHANTGIRPIATRVPEWMTVEDIIAADASFNKAFEAGKGDKDIMRRLRAARLGLDRAILENFDYYAREAEKKGLNFDLDAQDVCYRVLDAVHEQIELRGYADYTITDGVDDYGWVEKFENMLDDLMG